MGEVNKTYCGDALEVLKTFPDNFIDCCVTSPPYFGLRDYGVSGQIGLEKTPDEFVSKLTEIFTEVRRVLKPTGTLWLNLGDSYAGSGRGLDADGTWNPGNGESKQGTHRYNKSQTTRKVNENSLNKKSIEEGAIGNAWVKPPRGYKPKDLIGIPWMVAFALRNSGWYLRQDIIWHKPNPMPESVTDRCTKAHEYIFLLSKSARYYYDAEAISEKSVWFEKDSRSSNGRTPHKSGKSVMPESQYAINGVGYSENGMRNKRSVWMVTTKPTSEAHFATFPPELIDDCIKAGSSEHGCCSECGNPYERIYTKKLIPGPKASFNSVPDARDFEADKQDQGSNRMKDGHKPGWINKTETTGWKPTCKCGASVIPALVLDPFNGSGTTRIVAEKLGRNSIGIELNPKYIQIENRRRKKELGMFEKIAS